MEGASGLGGRCAPPHGPPEPGDDGPERPRDRTGDAAHREGAWREPRPAGTRCRGRGLHGGEEVVLPQPQADQRHGVSRGQGFDLRLDLGQYKRHLPVRRHKPPVHQQRRRLLHRVPRVQEEGGILVLPLLGDIAVLLQVVAPPQELRLLNTATQR